MSRKRPTRGGARPGAGAPRRTQDGAARTMSLRLTAVERARLKALAAKWLCSESDAARRAIEMAANEEECR